MNKNWFLICIAFLGIQFSYAQFNFRQHKIKAGDDVYSIAKEYGTTSEAILELNPWASEGIQPGKYLVIPNVISIPEMPVVGIEFKKHKTRKRQTLYSISKKYGVSVEDIKKYNSFLEEEELKKGDILRIPLPAPKNKKVIRSLNNPGANPQPLDSVADEKKSETQIYTVKPKETRYGIARKFGITIPELENMNPNLGEEFPIGLQILVPAEVKKEESVISSKLKLYKVPPKQTMYSLGKEFEVSTDSILKLNPELKDGLKAGMIIQVPNKGFDPNMLVSEQITDLSKQVFSLEEKKIAVLLPFGVSNFPSDDDMYYKDHLEKSKVTRIAVDFYSGLVLAFEKAKDMGLKINVTVADTQKKEAMVESLVHSKKLNEVDAVIGPLYKKNVDKLASILEKSNVPVFSPISNRSSNKYTNLYQTRPDSKVLHQKLIRFIKKDTLKKNIIVIADNKHIESKKELEKAFPQIKVLDPIKNNFIKEQDLMKIIGKGKDKISNWVILESSNLVLVSNVVSLLNAKAKSHNVTLFTTDKSSVFDNEAVSNQSLSNLNFHYTSTNKTVEERDHSFFEAYVNKYEKSPNSYAIRGYDLGLDVILRLVVSEDISDLNGMDTTTEYIENKFAYYNQGDKGISNKASYIVKYCEGLKFQVVE